MRCVSLSLSGLFDSLSARPVQVWLLFLRLSFKDLHDKEIPVSGLKHQADMVQIMGAESLKCFWKLGLPLHWKRQFALSSQNLDTATLNIPGRYIRLPTHFYQPSPNLLGR